MRKKVDLFATPSGMSALQHYVELFSAESEVRAAKAGLEHWEEVMVSNWVDYVAFCKEHQLGDSDKIVTMTVAGMRWNLECEIERADKVYMDALLQKTKLTGEHDAP